MMERANVVRLWPFVALVIALVVASNQDTRTSPIGQSMSSTRVGLILGRVVEGLTATAVSDAVVRLVGNGIGTSTQTDGDGDFVFQAIPKGSYSITASKSGYLFGSPGQRRPSGGSRSVVLADGQSVSGLIVPVWRLSGISGTVTDERGRPVAGQVVEALPKVAMGGAWVIAGASDGTTVRTDDQGIYHLAVPPGSYVTRLPWSQGATVGERRMASMMFYPAADAADQAAVLDLLSGEERQAVDFRLAPVLTRQVQGRVDDPAGRQTGGVVVQLALVDRLIANDVVASTTCAADGSFVFPQIPSGDYVLRVLDGAPSGESNAGRPDQPGRDALRTASGSPHGAAVRWASQPLSVADRDVTGVILELRPAARIRGQVVFDGVTTFPSEQEIALIRVYVSVPSGRALPGGAGLPVAIDTKGGFQTAALPAGQYFVRIVPRDVPMGWSVASISVAGRDAVDQPVALAESDVSGLLIRLTNTVSVVRGTVRTSAGASDRDSAVLIFPVGREHWTGFGRYPPRLQITRAGTSGEFVFKGLPPGEYLATAIQDEFAADWQTQERLDQISRGATRFRLAAGETKVLDLRATPGR